MLIIKMAVYASLFVIMSLLLATYNVNGCHDTDKRQNTLQFLKSHNLDICLLQETHSTPDTESLWNTEWRGNSLFCHGTNTSQGLAVLFSENLNYDISSVGFPVQGRCIHLHGTFRDMKLNIFNIHAPNNGKERADFFKNLLRYINDLDNDDACIVAGDFNTTLEPQIDRRSGKEPHVAAMNSLRDMITAVKLVDTYRNQNPDKIAFTWSSDCKSKNAASRLDRFYVSDFFYPSVINTEILDSYKSDHCLVRLRITKPDQKHNPSPHWCLNTEILNEASYNDEIETFWRSWQRCKADYKSLSLWWEIGKNRIRLISKMYSRKRNKNSLAEENDLKNIISDLEKLPKPLIEDNDLNLEYTKNQLRIIQENKIQGACIRSRFKFSKEFNTPSPYFYRFEKKENSKRKISHLIADNGEVVCEPEGIKQIATAFYTNLYSKEETDSSAQDTLLQNLPVVGDENKEMCDQPISLEELTAAVTSSSNSKTPGLDGLPFEFYKTFWETIGQDLLDVINYAIENNDLPISCKRSVITLIPKKGDLGLIKNWRPVSLLCSDYKLLTKVLSNRLKKCLPEIIHPDQSYTVPNRTITHNVSLIRDIIFFANTNNIDLAILSLDQEKAFDRIDHEWLQRCIKTFGFGDFFTSCIKLLYTDAQCLLKLNSSLCAPFKFSRGIRQGCPLSGSLYALAIEPLLNHIRLDKSIQGITLPGCQEQTKQSAYADDLDIVVIDDTSFLGVQRAIELYERSSSSKINYPKSSGLWCGAWRSRTDQPLGLTWNSQGIKHLGVFIGNSKEFEKQNWSNVLTKIKTKLGNWTPVLNCLTHKGKTLLINNLVASSLLYKLQNVTPPSQLIAEAQKLMLNFFWCENKHWISSEILSLQIQDGGLALIDLKSKIRAFRVSFLKDALGGEKTHPCFALAKHFLKSYMQLGYTAEILSTKICVDKLANLPPFYAECLRAVALVTIDNVPEALTIEEILSEPLFCNVNILPDFTPENSLLFKANLTHIVDLLDEKFSFKSLQEIHAQVPHNSQRLLSKELTNIKEAMPNSWLSLLKRISNQTLSPSVRRYSLVIPEIYNQEDVLKTSPLDGVSTKHLYDALTIAQYNSKYVSCPSYRWNDYFNDYSKPVYTAIFSDPIKSDHAFIHFKVLHGAVPTGLFRYNAGMADSPNCLFCGNFDDIFHSFIHCDHLTPLARYVAALVEKANPDYRFSIKDYVFLFPPKKNIFVIYSNYIYVTSKAATYKALVNKIFNEGSTDPLEIFKSYYKYAIKLEYLYFLHDNDLDGFINKWCHNEVFCKIIDNQLIWS